MAGISEFYKTQLLESGFHEEPPAEGFCRAGQLYSVPGTLGEGFYWVYAQKDLYDIKIHDFFFYEDSFLNMDTPECLSITFFDSVSGEELSPYRRLAAGSVKSFVGGQQPYQANFHKNIPIRSIGIEILPAYYETYLKEVCCDEYKSPYDSFLNIGQTKDFPEMILLLRQVWNYRGEGMSAKLFYDSKVSEALSLIVAYNKKQKESRQNLSAKDLKLIENVAAYINDHFNSSLSLDYLSRIACMSPTKLKASFKQVYECTITEYIQQRRLSHAESLLAATDFTIEQVAAAVGHSNAGRFANIFQKSTGLFPAEYRKMAQRKE
jgi:AraC-like DNA-binding protein